jgi:hypothetical protein
MSGGGFTPVPLSDVAVTGSFWRERLETVLSRTIPSQHAKLDEAGILDSLKLPQPPPPLTIPRNAHGFTTQVFWDSDAGKWVEAAGYALSHRRDAEIEAKVDAMVEDLARAQSPDGYLNCWYNGREPDRRWTNLRDNHELYNAGHLLEGAIAYFRATGRRRFLDFMERYVDHIAATFGTAPGRLVAGLRRPVAQRHAFRQIELETSKWAPRKPKTCSPALARSNTPLLFHSGRSPSLSKPKPVLTRLKRDPAHTECQPCHEDAGFLVSRERHCNVRTVGMSRLRIGFLAVSLFGALGSAAAFAQSNPGPTSTDSSNRGVLKPHAPKNAHRDGTHAIAPVPPNSEDAAKAAHIAAARKKFFEQSDGFDNATPGAVFLGGGNGLTPGAGFRF